MRYLLLLWLLLPTFGWTQKNNFELGLQLDNDSFVSTFNDFYYTSGLFLFANYRSAKSTSEKKIVHGFKIGQQIYNPRDVKSVLPEDHNRPYAGYLFAEYNRTKMYSSNRIIGMSFKLGVVGPDSKAVDFQNWMHDAFGFGEIMGWEQQIQNLLAIQFELRYSKPILKGVTSDKIDFHLLAATEIGTAFSSLNIGTLSRISLSKPLKAMHNSNYYNGLGSTVKELYFFVSPKVNAQAYDATIQGSMFTNESPVTFNLKPIRFNGEAGLKIKYYQYNLSCMINYTTDEIKNSSATGYFYGSIVGSYVF